MAAPKKRNGSQSLNRASPPARLLSPLSPSLLATVKTSVTPADPGTTRAKRGSPVAFEPAKRHRKSPPSSPKDGLGGAAPAAAAAAADFFIDGTQGQLEVCESRSILVDGVQREYLLVRLRGQSNTLPNDASLTVRFGKARQEKKLDLKFCRVRLKARELKFDYLPEPTQLDRAGPR